MAVVDRDELPVEVLRGLERFEQLPTIDQVTRLRSRMHVAAAEDPSRGLVFAEQEATALLRRRFTRVRENLLAKRAWEDELSSFDQRPPAIAGMTMTSLPSG